MNHVGGLAATLLLFASTLGAETISAPQPPAAAPIEQLKGVKFTVSDIQASTRIYAEVLGLKVARSIASGPRGKVSSVIMTLDGTFEITGAPWLVLKLRDPTSSHDRSAFGQLLVIAADMQALMDRARKDRLSVRQFEHGIVVISDPDGNEVEALPQSATAKNAQ